MSDATGAEPAITYTAEELEEACDNVAESERNRQRERLVDCRSLVALSTAIEACKGAIGDIDPEDLRTASNEAAATIATIARRLRRKH